MIVNPKIKEMLAEIATNAQHLSNRRDERKKYIRKLVKLYINDMSEEEQLYLALEIFEQINYKNIVTDPDTLIALNNVKHRTYFLIFSLTVIGMLVAAGLFKTNASLNELMLFFGKLSTMLSL